MPQQIDAKIQFEMQNLKIKMHLQKCFLILRMWLHYWTHK